MRQMRCFAAIVAAVTCCLGAAAGPVPAAPVQVIGQTASAEGEVGGCICSVVQLADSGTNPYLIPGNGVLTKTSVWVGNTTEPGDMVQARTFTTSGGTTAKALQAGETHSLSGFISGSHLFYERIPVTAGEVLGARFHDSALITETPSRFKSGSTSDLAGDANSPADPAVGQSFGVSAVPKWRVNMAATYEPDDDADGYGDASQDLCPGSPVATTACSGILFGSDLAGPHGTFANCGFACLNIQKSIGGQSTAAVQDGVVVRWRVLGATTGSYRIRVLAPSGGQYTLLRSSDPGAVTSEPVLTEKIHSFATRLPIPAGAYVALAAPVSTTLGFRSGAGSSYEDVDDHVADGTTSSMTGQASGTILYDADIEPDADHDGYGDISQDSCPGTGAIHEGTCPKPPLPGPKLRVKAPKIASVKRDKKGRYVVRVMVQQAGTITAKLTGKLKPKGKAVKLGKAATKKAGKSGTYTLTLKPPKAAREAKLRATLTVSLAASGYEAARASKRLKLG